MKININTGTVHKNLEEDIFSVYFGLDIYYDGSMDFYNAEQISQRFVIYVEYSILVFKEHRMGPDDAMLYKS